MAKTKNVPGDFADKARTRWKDAKEFSANWRRDARHDYAFDAGDQWLEDDKRILDEQRRPPITFNYTSKMLDAVVGVEVSNRQEVKYLPREMGDVQVSELWSNVAKWVRESCNAEDEETDSFRDCLVCGMGWTRTKIDYEEVPDGKILIERIDPLEVYWDPAATKAGLSDARYVIHAVWLDKSEAKRLWPGNFIYPEEKDAVGTGHIVQGHRYDEAQDETEMHKDQVRVLHYECVEKEPYYRVVHPSNGEIAEMSEGAFKKLRNEIEDSQIPYVRQVKRVYYRAFMAGDTILEKGLSPCQKGFTFQCITGKRDRNHNTWYGLLRVMRDPQQWANKWLSQILHIINTNAKGGLLAEVGAFVDPAKAADEWAQPDAITLLNEGGLGRVQQKQPAPYPQGLDRLMDFALNSLPMVTGINLEALGLANREQAGVLESQRKQAAYGILAPLFDSLRRYRKEQGAILLQFIRDYISDGRLVRVAGREAEQFIQLTKIPETVEYDIIVDQSPTSPDVKQKTWETLMQLVPSLLKAGIPLPPDLLDFTPLPQTLVQKWKAHVEQQKQTVSPEQMQQLQQQMQQLQQENQELKNDQSAKMMQVQGDQQESQAELQLKVQESQQSIALKRQQMEAEFALKKEEMEREFALEQAKLGHDMEMRRMQTTGDLKLKAMQAGVEAPEDGSMNLKLDVSDISDAVKEMSESNKALGSAIIDSQKTMAEALGNMTEALSRPKIVVKDSAGRPVGIKPVNKLN